MKLLQVPTALLEQRIKEEMEVNPALEETNDEFADEQVDYEAGTDAAGEEAAAAASNEADAEETQYSDENFDLDDYLNGYMEDDPASYKERGESYQADEEEKTVPVAIENSFHEYLEQQIGLLNLSNEREETIAIQIIGSIDEDGYLRREPYAIADDLLFSQNLMIEEKEVVDILKKIQRLDPPGIGARDLRECLLLQLENRSRRQNNVELAWRIVKDHLYDLGTHQHERISRFLGVSLQEIRAAAAFIKKLNPRPVTGQGMELTKNLNIIPEFVVEKDEVGDLHVHLAHANSSALRVSANMQERLRSMEKRKEKLAEKTALQYLRSKVDSALWFVEMVRQREHSMLVTMQAIVRLQQEYFLSGDHRKLHPMILKDVAQITQLDISTISRVTSLKYVQTDFGTIHLKDLFQQGMAKSDGEMVTNKEISELIATLIGEEDKQAPVSDQQICNVLQEKGYNLARRTVAKYRDLMNIPIAKMRRDLEVPNEY